LHNTSSIKEIHDFECYIVYKTIGRHNKETMVRVIQWTGE
jgi:hypothetical protein